jgi:hypothetical protein
MNKGQLKVLWIGIGLIALMGLVPPWVHKSDGHSVNLLGYASFFSPPETANSVDTQRLEIQWALVAIICAGWAVSVRSKTTGLAVADAVERNDRSEKRGMWSIILRFEVMVSIVVLSLAMIPYGLSEYGKEQERVLEEHAEQARAQKAAAEQQEEQARAQKAAAEQQLESDRRQAEWDSQASRFTTPVRYGWKQCAVGRLGTIAMYMPNSHTLRYRLDLYPDQSYDYGHRTLDFEDKNGFSVMKDDFYFGGGKVITRQCEIDCNTYERIAGFDLLEHTF